MIFTNKLDITILVIGGSGLLGSKIIQHPISTNQFGTFYTNKHDDLLFLDVQDIESIDSVIYDTNPDIILYTAGITDVDGCELSQTVANNINCKAVKYICSKYTGIKFVYYSTDYVFDGKNPPYTESDKPNPINYYGLTKLEAERYTLNSNAINLVIRVSGLYDSTQNNNSDEMILAEDDRFSRPINVLDVIRTTYYLISNDKSGLYHVVGNNTLSRYEYCQIKLMAFEEFSHTVRPIISSEKSYLSNKPKDSSLKTDNIDSKLFTINKIGLCDTGIVINKENESKLTIFVDCIGGVLASRTWKSKTTGLSELDKDCGTVDASTENNIIKKCEDNDVSVIDIVNLYTINQYLWPYLIQWRTKHRLILVNNGWSQTFRFWVEKYCLSKMFDIVVNSHEFGVRKENPYFFELLAQKHDINLNNSVIIDDDVNVINTCNNLGIKPIQTIRKTSFPVDMYIPKNQALIDAI